MSLSARGDTAPPTGEADRAAGDEGRVLQVELKDERHGDRDDVHKDCDDNHEQEKYVTAEILLQNRALQPEMYTCHIRWLKSVI